MGEGANPAEAQHNQKEGSFSLLLVCVLSNAYVCMITRVASVCVLHVVSVVCRPGPHSESTTQPPHADTLQQHQSHSSQRRAYN